MVVIIKVWADWILTSAVEVSNLIVIQLNVRGMRMSDEFSRTYTWQDPMPAVQQGLQMAGLEYMQALVNGDFPPPPIAKTLNFWLAEVKEGYAMFECEPQDYHYNPIGVVHGGLAATLLDSALGCAIHTTMPKGMGYTTVQLNVNMTRAITSKVKKLRAIGTVIHSGRQMATADARLIDEHDKLYAHGTTTCFVFPLPDAK
jgi:uncharacterized protein (TIGR00369 family)